MNHCTHFFHPRLQTHWILLMQHFNNWLLSNFSRPVLNGFLVNLGLNIELCLNIVFFFHFLLGHDHVWTNHHLWHCHKHFVVNTYGDSNCWHFFTHKCLPDIPNKKKCMEKDERRQWRLRFCTPIIPRNQVFGGVILLFTLMAIFVCFSSGAVAADGRIEPGDMILQVRSKLWKQEILVI